MEGWSERRSIGTSRRSAGTLTSLLLASEGLLKLALQVRRNGMADVVMARDSKAIASTLCNQLIARRCVALMANIVRTVAIMAACPAASRA